MTRQLSYSTAFFLAIFALQVAAHGQNLRWDVTAGDGATVTDGPGTNWTQASRWNNGTTNVNWSNGSNALFGGGSSGTAGSVGLTGNVIANSVTFNTPFAGNYSIATGANTLTVNSGITANRSASIGSTGAGSLTLGGNNAISVAGGQRLTISSPVADGVNSFGITKSGDGMLELSGNNNYQGVTNLNAGSTFMIGNNSSVTGGINVASGATLGGYQTAFGDTIGSTGGGTTTVAGTLTPGGGRTEDAFDSLGVISFHSPLTLQTGSTFVWDLITNDGDPFINNRGFNYDGVDTNGGLTIQSGATARLRFNSNGSDVDWTSAFWQSNRSWLVFDNASSPTLLDPDVFDSTSLEGFGGVPGYPFARFTWSLSGNDIYLNFTAVPEPANFGISALLLGIYATRRKRRRSKIKTSTQPAA